MTQHARFALYSPEAAEAPDATGDQWLDLAGVDAQPLSIVAPDGLQVAAWELDAEHPGALGLRELVQHETGAGLAALLVPPALLGSRRSLIVTDVDSTLIEQEVIELLAAHAGREAEVAAVTERAMRGELDFAESLHHRVKVLAGLPTRIIDEVAEQVVPTAGARELIAAAHARGNRVGAVSGGFIQVLEPLAARLGLDHAQANVLGVREGVLTGTVEGPVVDRAAKASALRRWCAADDVNFRRTIGIGDGANDLDLLTVAGMGVGIEPKPALRVAADAVLGLRRLDVLASALGWLD